MHFYLDPDVRDQARSDMNGHMNSFFGVKNYYENIKLHVSRGIFEKMPFAKSRTNCKYDKKYDKKKNYANPQGCYNMSTFSCTVFISILLFHVPRSEPD
jgi:hypothetical protein